MSYEKQTWATGDVITAEKLNHMEDGIAGAGGSDVKYLSATIHNDSESYPLAFASPNIVPIDIETFRLYDSYSESNNGGVEPNATRTVYFLYSNMNNVVQVPLGNINSSSNAVNCEVKTDEYEATYIEITDPTQNSSIDLVMTGTR